MPTQESTTAIAPVDGEYQLKIRDFDAAGASNTFSIPVPEKLTAAGASVMFRAALLKNTSLRGAQFPIILHAVMYADAMGLDIMAGDVYIVDGRIATTAGAKIRHAMASGRVEGYEVEITPGTKRTLDFGVKGKHEIEDMTATVTVYVKGWTRPVVYKTTLGEWYVPTNPNWKTRPAYMLRRNALSKVMEEVAPMGVEPEEAPPAETPNAYNGSVAGALAQAKAAVIA